MPNHLDNIGLRWGPLAQSLTPLPVHPVRSEQYRRHSTYRCCPSTNYRYGLTSIVLRQQSATISSCPRGTNVKLCVHRLLFDTDRHRSHADWELRAPYTATNCHSFVVRKQHNTFCIHPARTTTEPNRSEGIHKSPTISLIKRRVYGRFSNGKHTLHPISSSGE